jgi:transcriptional regulator with XRE-family HTH domain
MPETTSCSTENAANAMPVVMGGIANSKLGLLGADTREVVRCSGCHLVQFRTLSDHCRRCQGPLPRPQSELEPVAAQPEPETVKSGTALDVRIPLRGESEHRTKTIGKQSLGPKLRELREFRNLTQADLAGKARVPRTYISRIERAHLMPGLGVLRRLADALAVGLLDLVPGNFPSQVSSSFPGLGGASKAFGSPDDPYWNSLVRYSRCLRPEQKSEILSRVRAMAERQPMSRVA